MENVQEYDREKEGAEAAQAANDAKMNVARRIIAEACGLSLAGQDDDGEDEFLGTIEKHRRFQREFDLYMETGSMTENHD